MAKSSSLPCTKLMIWYKFIAINASFPPVSFLIDKQCDHRKVMVSVLENPFFAISFEHYLI